MRASVAVFGVLAGVMLAGSGAALAAPKCQTTIPKEWDQPRVSYTFSGQSYGSGYARGSSSSYSARSTTSRSYSSSSASDRRWR